MVAVGKDAAGAAENGIEALGEADRKRLHALRECRRARGLDEQVQVIGEHGILDDTHESGRRERTPDDPKRL
jgi:hypothetical protein